MGANTAFTKVADIHPAIGHVNAILKVVSFETKLQCIAPLTECKLSEVTCGDETGTVILRVGQNHSCLCATGSTIVLRGARVNMFNGQMRLELGRWSRLTAVNNAVFNVPVDTLETDASMVRHVLVST